MQEKEKPALPRHLCSNGCAHAHTFASKHADVSTSSAANCLALQDNSRYIDALLDFLVRQDDGAIQIQLVLQSLPRRVVRKVHCWNIHDGTCMKAPTHLVNV